MSLRITFKAISTALVLLVLFFVLAYPTSTALRAPVIILAFLWILIRSLLTRKFRLLTPLHTMWAIGFFALVVLSKFWHLYPQAVDNVKNNVQWSMMISIIIVDYIVTYRVSVLEFAKLLIPIAIIYLLNALLNGTRDAENRLSIGINENGFGKIGMGMSWLFLYVCHKVRWRKPLWIVLLATVTLVAFLSGSRRVVISLAIYAAGYMLFEYPSKDAFKLAGKILGALIVLVAMYVVIINVDVLYSTIGNRIESLLMYLFADGEADGSTFSRMNMQGMALEMFREHPLLGAGINAFKYHVYYNTYSHSNFTELLSGLGLVGFGLYYIPIIIMFKIAFQSWQKKTAGAIVPLCYLVAFLLNEYGGVSYFSYIDHLYLAVTVGFVYLSKKNEAMPTIPKI